MDAQSDLPPAVRYIKLGRGGAWAGKALENGTIPFGYNAVPHQVCNKDGWDEAARLLAENGRTRSGVSQGLRELQDFYDLTDGSIFVTMANGHLWWTLVEGPVVPLSEVEPGGPTRFRCTRGGWSDKNMVGERLALSSLSSALTRTANYRATLCTIESVDYLLRRIRGEAEPLHVQAVVVQDEMRRLGSEMIAGLHWRDLEALTDLIFVRDGWKRISVLGEDQPDVDLLLEHSTTRQKAWVQVKTGAKQADLDANRDAFVRYATCDRFYFVCSQPAGALRLADNPLVQVWTGARLADAALDAGLFSWLMERTK